MAKRSSEGSASMPAQPTPNGQGQPSMDPTVYVTLWLSGNEHQIQTWKLPDAKRALPATIERGKPLFACVPGLKNPLTKALHGVRANGLPATVLLPTPLGPLPCFCTPVQPEPHTDSLICALPLAFFADAVAPTAIGSPQSDDAAAFGAFPVLMMEVDLTGRVIAVNPRMRTLMQVDIGHSLLLNGAQQHPAWHKWENDDPYRWCDLPVARVLQDYQPIEEFMLHRASPHAETIPFLAKAQPIHDATGAVMGAAWLLLPLTTKVYADGITHRRATAIIAVVESMRDGILLYDAQGKLWQMNPAARQILGWDRVAVDPIDASLGVRSRAYAPQYNDGRPLADADWPLQRALRGENTDVVELSIKRIDSVRINVGVLASPLHDAEGTIMGAVAVIRDMTAHHRFEKLREIFMSLASHELRTPLTTLVLAHRIMQGRLLRSGADAALRDLNGDLYNQIRLLNRLVDNMLDMTGLTGGQFELRRQRADVAKIVRDVIDELAQLHKRTPRTFIPTGFLEPLWLDIDAQRFSQVIYNLISNAIKFSPAHKPIEIEAEYFKEGNAHWFSINITDLGVGIPAEQIPTLFERVIDAEEVSHSSGMGYSLYLARAIMQHHDGAIKVNSVFNFGSTFSVWLPLTGATIEDDNA